MTIYRSVPGAFSLEFPHTSKNDDTSVSKKKHVFLRVHTFFAGMIYNGFLTCLLSPPDCLILKLLEEGVLLATQRADQ